MAKSSLKFDYFDSKLNRELRIRNIRMPLTIKKHNQNSIIMSIENVNDGEFLKNNIKKTEDGFSMNAISEDTRKSSTMTMMIPRFVESLTTMSCTHVDAMHDTCTFKNVSYTNLTNVIGLCKIYGLQNAQNAVSVEKRGFANMEINKISANSLNVIIDGNGSLQLLGIKITEEAGFKISGDGWLSASFDGGFDVLNYKAAGFFSTELKPFISTRNLGPKEAFFDLSDGAGISKCRIPIGILDLILECGSKDFHMHNDVWNGVVSWEDHRSGRFIVDPQYTASVFYQSPKL